MLRQNINNPLAQQRSIVNTGGLVADPFTGSTNDVVLLFGSAGTVSGPTADIVETNSATDGTSVTLTAPGVYIAKLFLQVNAATSLSIIAGLSVDQTTNLAAANPAFATPGVIAVRSYTLPTAEDYACEIAAAIMVRPEDESSGRVVRFLASDGSAGAPSSILTAASCYYTIEQVNQLHQ